MTALLEGEKKLIWLIKGLETSFEEEVEVDSVDG